MKRILLVGASLLLTYVFAFITLMIRWMNFWIRGAYFVSYQAIFSIALAIFLLWWLRRHHTGPLPVSSTILYSTAVGYVSGLIAMALYPISQPDGLQQVAMGLRFPTPEAVAAFLWFPVRMLAWLFGGIAGLVMLAMSQRFKFLVLVALSAFLLNPMTGKAQEDSSYERIGALAHGSPMITVGEGFFLMGTARTGHDLYSLDLPYDDTEQPQRRVWLDGFEIERDEVSLGEFLLWLNRQHRAIPAEMRKLIDHMMTVHAASPDTLARWPALYATWTEASDFCRAQGKRLPTETEWEKAARGEKGYLFPWGHKPPAIGLAMFGQYHVHEIPIVASVERGEEGRSPYGLHHMAGNAAEWVEDWFGIDYYATMPERNPRGAVRGRYKVVRGGSWKSAPPLLRTATRSGAAPEQRAVTIGFRCAKSIR